MADSTIPNLPAFSGTPNGTEEMETVQSGVSVKIASQKVADLATIVTPITKAALISAAGLNQISVYKLYLITNATAGRLLVKGLTTSTIEDGVLNMTTGQSGTYVLGTDTFTAAGSGNANITPITAAALLALPSFSTTTIYVVTDANSNTFKMAIQAETTSQLGQTGTIVDDVYSGVVDYNLATNTFLNGTIYDGSGNIWNGCLPSATTLGTSAVRNTFNQGCALTAGNGFANNIIGSKVSGFILGNNFVNTEIEDLVVGADYTASPAYNFLYSNAYHSTIFVSGGINYHRYFDVANDRIVITDLATPTTVTYIGGGLTNPMTTGGDIIYGGASGVPTRLANGTAGQVLQSNGTTLAPSWVAASGGGDVFKVGTPVNNQVGVWTGDGTIEGDAALTFDTSTDTLGGMSNIEGAAAGLTITTATNGDITIDPAGSGTTTINAGSGGVDITTDAGNADINITPHNSGRIKLKNADLTNSFNEAQGTNIASATTTDVGAATGNYVVVTGTTTITGLGTVQAGTRRIVNFSGILILTHNGTSLILPTAANITTAAGDTATFISLGSGNWVCVNYMRASGAALVGGSTNTYSVNVLSSTLVTVADSTSYHFGINIDIPATTTLRREFKFPQAGTMTAFSFNLLQSTNGSNQTCTLYLRNTTSGTDYTIGTFTSDFGLNGALKTVFSGLSIAVNTTDDWVVKILTPAFTTNPANWLPNGLILIET
jgi:hypothetical protein